MKRCANIRNPALAARRPAHVPAAPPRILNIVHQKLKPGTSQSYEALEMAIVAAYEQAHVPLFWIMLQSRADATDIVYLNVAESLEEWNELPARYRKVVAAHPELEKMSARLATFIERTTSTLTTRRDEIPFSRSGIDLQTMRAMRLTVFQVSPGHEGRFVNAARGASDRAAPWLFVRSERSPHLHAGHAATDGEARQQGVDAAASAAGVEGRWDAVSRRRVRRPPAHESTAERLAGALGALPATLGLATGRGRGGFGRLLLLSADRVEALLERLHQVDDLRRRLDAPARRSPRRRSSRR